MATFYGYLNNGYQLRLHVTQQSRDETANTSVVAWSLELVKTGSYTAQSGYQNPWSVNIEGNPRSGTKTYNFNSYTNLVLGSGTVTIPHNSDGTKAIAANASFDDVANLVGDGNVPTSFLALTPNPRGSKARLTNPTTGAAQSHTPANTPVRINTDRASSNYTHTIRYALGSASGTIATGVTDSVDWTPPLSLLTQFPNGPTGYGYIWVDTYSGGTLIQTRDTTFAVTVPASVVPSVGTVSVVEATAGLAANVGAHVQGLTTFTVSTSGEAGIYGSTITEVRTEVAGQNLVGDPVTTGVINASGAVPVKVTVTDSRGQKASTTVSRTVLAYAAPKINSMTVQRALSSGTPDESGSYLRVNFNASVSSLLVTTQRNAMTYRIYVKLKGAASWGTAKSTVTLPVGTTSFNSYVNLSPYLLNAAYEVRLEVQDDFNVIGFERQVTTAEIAVHFDANLGMGVGKYRQYGMLDVAGAIFHNDGRPVPFAVAMGTVTKTGGLNVGVSHGINNILFPAKAGGGNRFTQVPYVFTQTSRARITTGVSSETTSGFNLLLENWSAGNEPGDIVVRWLAIQMASTGTSG